MSQLRIGVLIILRCGIHIVRIVAQVFPMSTFVCYHLPSDRDDPEHPNAFQINKPVEDVTLQDVKDNFPLPGNYHFRFRVRMGDSNNSYWMDITDGSRIVPAFGPRRIIAKVLRLSWQGPSHDHKPPVHAPLTQAKQLPTQSPPSRPAAETIDLFGGSSPPANNPVTHANKSHVGDLDLFG